MLALAFLNLYRGGHTCHTSREVSSSLRNSNDFWWSYQCVLKDIWQFMPTYFRESCELGTRSILHDHSSLPFWYQDLNDYATSPDTASQYALTYIRTTWQVFRDGCPFLRAILLDQLDKICIFLSSPWSFFPLINHYLHLDAGSLEL